MAHLPQISPQIISSSKLPDGAQLQIAFSPARLAKLGFNIPVLVSVPSIQNSSNPRNQKELKSVTVMAHFDTGASITNIDKGLADYLGLIPVGAGVSRTAGGTTETLHYVVDISFPGCKLAPFFNLPISSCDLAYQFDGDSPGKMSPQNFGILLGRDVMTRWNIVWNGPTSTVFISD